jgi:hypothetical protein
MTPYGSLRIGCPSRDIDFAVQNGSNAPTKQDRKSLEDLFRRLDQNRDGFIDHSEAYHPPFAMIPYLRLVDRDGDGKISWREWTEYLDLRERISANRVVMSWVDRGQRLFDLLDTNHDGRLSRRELMNASARVAPYIRADGVRIGELPRVGQVVFRVGRPIENLPGDGSGVVNVFATDYRVRGPLWFRKMDLNRDGDLSVREFLGTAELFRKIDSNGDGLIDPEEAERSDSLFRARRMDK